MVNVLRCKRGLHWAGTELEGNLCYPKDAASPWAGSGAGPALRAGISPPLLCFSGVDEKRPQNEENVQQRVMNNSTCYCGQISL